MMGFSDRMNKLSAWLLEFGNVDIVVNIHYLLA